MKLVIARKTANRLPRLVICLFVICQYVAFAADWPQYRGPTGDGVSPDPIYYSSTDGFLTLHFTQPTVTFADLLTPVLLDPNDNSHVIDYGSTLTIGFNKPVSVFGFDVWEMLGGTGDFTVTFNGSNGSQAQQTMRLDYWNDQAFMGQFAAVGTGGEYLTSVQISAAVLPNAWTDIEVPVVTSLRYELDGPASVPEPASALLIGGALLGLGFVSRRRVPHAS